MPNDSYYIVAKYHAELDADALARLVLQLALQLAAEKRGENDDKREAA
jgi:hypothetical protein